MRPAGWPVDLPEPEDPEFPGAAVKWLLERGDPAWRRSPLSAHPTALAYRARCDVRARIEGARSAYGAARRELTDLPAEVLSEILAALESEGADLLALEREVGLIEEALHGARWRPRL